MQPTFDPACPECGYPFDGGPDGRRPLTGDEPTDPTCAACGAPLHLIRDREPGEPTEAFYLLR